MFPLPNVDDDDPLAPFLKTPPPTYNDIVINDHIPTSIHDLFITLPSPFFDDHELPLNQILPKNLIMNPPSASDQQQHHQPHANSPIKRTTSKLKGKLADDQTASVAARRRSLGVVPRRRPGKKDRHSKISTAHGIRDRRMRLSLQVARKFFDLQDMLGYDKASKTIEWLFSQSKKAIKEVIKESDPQGMNCISMSSEEKTESFASECEVVSGIDQENSNIEVKDCNNFVENEAPVSSKSCVKAEKIKSRKTVSKPNDMRESRENARARARSRTREKLMNKGVENSYHLYKSSPNCSNIRKLGSSNNPFEAHQAESGSINQQEPVVSPYGANEYSSTPFGQQMADVGTIEKLLGTSGSSAVTCPSMISDYYCSAGASCCIDPNINFNMGFLGYWDLLNSDSRINNSVTNEISLPGNPSSDYSVNTPNFPFYQ